MDHEMLDARVAFYTCLDKKLNNKKDGLLVDAKSMLRQEMLELESAFGTDRRPIRVNGEKVGEASISFSKPKLVIKQERMAEALEYLDDLDMVEIILRKGWEDRFKVSGGAVICRETGEVVDWCYQEDEGKRVVKVTGCKPSDVLEAFGNSLDGMEQMKMLMEAANG